jgi:hypothetical protein
MKKYLIITLILTAILLLACEGGSMKFITTDHDGYAEEYFMIPENGKIKITELDANCSEVEKAGKFYHTQYLFTLGELRTVLNTECTDFKPTEFINVEKGDKIKMMIKHGEASTRYKIKYEFVKTP